MASKRRRGKISRRMSMQRRRKMTFFILLAAFCVVFVFVGSYMALHNYVKKVAEHVICDNVYIGTVDVSGMTAKQAKSALKKHISDDAAKTVTLKVADTTTTATLEELGLTDKNRNELIKEAVAYGKEGTMWKRYRQMKKLEKEKLVIADELSLTDETAKTVLQERAAPLEHGATDATISKTADGFKLTKEKEGKAVDIKKTIKKINTYLNGKWDHKDFSMKVVTKVDKPKVTKKELSTVKDVLGTFSTDAGGGERWTNLQTGVGKLNGVVLAPGEVLSVYNTTAPYDEEHGYVPAGSYENGQVVDAYGGGICQVSTTLYNAVILAELEVEERYPHSMLVNYVDPSRDAAIAGDYLDFKFKNPYDTPIYIFGEIDANNQLNIIIYGKETRPANRTIAFESETLSTQEYGVTYQADYDSYIGNMEYTGSPHTGKEAQLWKIVYEDGVEVSREVFNTSSYAKSDEIIAVGVKSSSDTASSLVANAIGTQDESKIQAAINQASGMLSGGGESTGNESDGSGSESSGSESSEGGSEGYESEGGSEEGATE